MHLLIGSTTAYSGKSAVALGLGLMLKARGLPVSYAKPLGTCPDRAEAPSDEDCLLMSEYLNAPTLAPLVFLDRASVRRRLSGEDTTDYRAGLGQYLAPAAGHLCLVEGAGSPQEGALFGLTLQVLAEHLPARVLLVCRYQTDLVIDEMLILQSQLGNRLVGVIFNDVPGEQYLDLKTVLVPFLERQGIAVFGVLPADALLKSLSVAGLATALGAEVLCCRHRLDERVESFSIGAMSVNAALKYFQTTANKAVVTGGDRTDLQLAALETSTACLVLTGHLPPTAMALARAEALEVPVLSVAYDTLATVEIIERTFAQVRFREPHKVERIQALLAKHFDLERFYEGLPARA